VRPAETRRPAFKWEVTKGGNLELLMKWLREHEPPWPPWEEEIIVKADRGGNLEG